MSNSETGHAKNVANFQTLISYCSGYGDKYNPSKASLQLTSLNALHTAASGSLSLVKTNYSDWANAVNKRAVVFQPISKLVTRVINALEASDVSKPSVANAKAIAKKIQGKRTSAKENPAPVDPNTPAEENPKYISASQTSFDNRIENFDKLIKVLSGQAGYAPNETDLTVASLTALHTLMAAANKDATDFYTALSNARISRDEVLYKNETGLTDIAANVKSYIKSVFGASSPQFKQVSGLQFVSR